MTNKGLWGKVLGVFLIAFGGSIFWEFLQQLEEGSLIKIIVMCVVSVVLVATGVYAVVGKELRVQKSK